MMEPVSRNAPCPCGSGKKYKQCCGSLAGGDLTAPLTDTPVILAPQKQTAVAMLEQGQLAEAERLFRKILSQAPKDFDALHMLGVIAAQLGRPLEALGLILEAARLDSGDYVAVYDNLGRVILNVAQLLGGYERAACPDLADTDLPQRLFRDDLPELAGARPLVSVVIPCYNHERYVEEALRSVFAQTYSNIELVVIDDGSRDRTVERIERTLADSPFPARFIARENRGAHVTINEGIGMAAGEYVGILNSDDRFTPYRLDALVRLLVSTGKAWGFAGVSFIAEAGDRIAYGQNTLVDTLMQTLDRIYSESPICLGFSTYNFAISTGNLFFSRALWQELGAFRDYRYVHDWDFCLRALGHESPAILHEPGYEYRLHGANTIKEALDRSKTETNRMLAQWGQELREEASLNRARHKLLTCAWERAMLSTNQANLVGRQRLLDVGQRALKSAGTFR